MGELRLIVGNPVNPIWTGYPSQAKGFFGPEFVTVYDHWRTFKAGLGLPWGDLTEADPDLVAAIRGFEEYWQRHYSPDHVTQIYLEAIIKRLDARR